MRNLVVIKPTTRNTTQKISPRTRRVGWGEGGRGAVGKGTQKNPILLRCTSSETEKIPHDTKYRVARSGCGAWCGMVWYGMVR